MFEIIIELSKDLELKTFDLLMIFINKLKGVNMKKFVRYIGFLLFVFLLATTIQAQNKPEQSSQVKIHRYVVERDFPDGLSIPVNEKGCSIVSGVVSKNAEDHVTWVHSYVSKDKKKTYCIYDAPSPEAIKKVADKNGLPVGKITEVTVLDPYFYN